MHQKDINEIREKDFEKLDKLTRTMDDIARSRVSEIEGRANKIKAKIQGLIDKKSEIFGQPYSKAELLRQAKQALKEGKKQFLLETLLIPYLKKCQVGKGNIFANHDMRVYLADPDRLWRYVFAIITEKDLEEAVGTLDEVGIPEAEREERIKKVDVEIEALQTQVKKELEKL